MADKKQREHMDFLIDTTRDALVDDFADVVKHLNNRDYDNAAVLMYYLGVSMQQISKGVATEALIRRLEKYESDGS